MSAASSGAILAIDTTGKACGVFVRQVGATDAQRIVHIGKGHDRILAPLVAEILEQEGLAARDLTRVAVAVGPGSFTGVRVGVAFARGLSLALGVPAVGVCNLDVLAAAVDSSPPHALIVAAHDARRGEIVWRAYRDGAPVSDARTQEVDAARRGILQLAGGDTVDAAGSGAELFAGDGLVDTGIRTIDLHILADLGETADPAASPAAPFYHRGPDAKLPGGVDPAAAP